MIFPRLLSSQILASLVVACCFGDGFAAQWVRPPSDAVRAQTPGLIHETFESDSMNTSVGYCVVLPPGYQKGSRRYPVVYWLHGGGGNESSSLFTAKAWHDLYRRQAVQEVILVYPNGFRSGYMDHHDGKVKVESMIIRELIPRIDRRFRTISSPAGRAVHGFSMGASGALKFAIKYPNLFCCAVAYGGGAIDLEKSRSRFILDILERNLKSDPELIRQNNTYHFLKQNHDTVRQRDIRFLMICGDRDSWKASAVAFDTALRDKGIPSHLTLVPNVGHNLRGLMQHQGAAAAVFQDKVFRAHLPQADGRRPQSALNVQETYHSRAEGRKQSFQVVLPPGYSPDKKYPLVVQVLGSNALLPTVDRPFIRIRPTGRGVWGYRSMSRYDVLQAIDRTKQVYSVDEDRVYMIGTSAGATGMMHTAAQRPDLFAGLVPLVAFGNDLPLENFRNLPVRCEHGVNDWTSAIGNVRVQFQRLKGLAYDAKLNEHARAGHGIRKPPLATLDWLFSLKRNRSPKRVTYSCEHPRDGRAYWLRIESFIDPHQVARIDAIQQADGLNITTDNIKQFSLDWSTTPLRAEQRLVVDGQPVAHTRGPAQTRLRLIKPPNWVQAASQANKPAPRAEYGAGAAANLFQGEPLLIVYGTGAGEQGNRFLKEAAELLARTGGPDFKPAQVRFPVRADTQLGDIDLRDFNLLLVGTSQNNSYIRQIAERLPFVVEADRLHAGNRTPLPLRGAVLGFHYYNPEQPRRLIYVVSPYLNGQEQRQFRDNPRRFLAGAPGFKMIDQPDLMVRGVDLRIRREMQLGADWRFVQIPGDEVRTPQRFANRTALAMSHVKVMRHKAGVDIALWWGPNDKGLFGGYDFNWLPALDPMHYTLADFRVRRRETETMTASVSGSELIEIHNRWIKTSELVTWPKVSVEDIDAERRYRIVIPMDLVAKLGIRRKTLSNVAPGPSVMPADVAAQVFDLPN